jgi:hypothetical protein
MGKGAIATAGMKDDTKTVASGKISNGIASIQNDPNGAGKNVSNCKVITCRQRFSVWLVVGLNHTRPIH